MGGVVLAALTRVAWELLVGREGREPTYRAMGRERLPEQRDPPNEPQCEGGKAGCSHCKAHHWKISLIQSLGHPYEEPTLWKIS